MEKPEARVELIKSKIYRFMATVFAVVGFLLFAFIFHRQNHGEVLPVIQNPMWIGLLIIMLSPAIVLSLKSRKAEKRLQKYLSEGEEPKK